MDNGELNRGHIDTVILQCLTSGDKDTNEIRKCLEDRSENKVGVKQGTFYSAMQRLTKQNLIREYRSSSDDGIRRKFFSINQKGLKYLERTSVALDDDKEKIQEVAEEKENQIKDNISKPLTTDSDISKVEDSPAQNDESYDEYARMLKSFDLKLDEILSEVKPSDNNEEPLVEEIEPTTESEIVVDVAKTSENCVETVEDVDILPSFDENQAVVIEEVDDSPVTDYQSPDPEPEKIVETHQNESEPHPEYETKKSYPFEIKYDGTYDVKLVEEPKVEEPIAETRDEDVEQLPIDEEIVNEVDQTPVVVEEVEEIKPEPHVEPKINYDLFEVEDGVKSNRREYKSILSSLFPKEPEIQVEEKKEIIETRVEKQEPAPSEIPESIPTQAEITAFSDPNVTEYEKSVGQAKVESKCDVSDFSDLYAMAAREGFKIKTSSNTNKFSGKRILVNKLNFVSSAVSYLLLFVQMIILNFCLDGVLNWSPAIKATIALTAAVFPLITFLIFIFNRNRKVKEIASFKDCIEISLIATFQLTIIILCVALFASIDFEDFKAVCEFVLLPFVLTLNIPLFFIIKYSLLATGKYSTSNE